MITFDLSDFEGSCNVKATQIFKAYKVVELGHMLLLNINRKACFGSPSVRLQLILVNLEGQCQSLRF